MDQELRKKRILEELNEHEFVNLQEFVKEFDVSEMTIRRDFNELEKLGLLIRKYGGAVRTEAIETMFSFNRRVECNSDKKEAICRKASEMIENHDSIFIDCGTTLFRLAHFIKKKRIRVITNSLPVVSELMNCPSIRLSFIGGDIMRDRQAAYGRIAEKTIQDYSANKAFLGVDGVSLAHGLSSFDEHEAMVTRMMAKQALTVYLLCDSSKIEKDSFFRFAPIDLVQYLITNEFSDIELRDEYIRAGVQIITS